MRFTRLFVYILFLISSAHKHTPKPKSFRTISKIAEGDDNPTLTLFPSKLSSDNNNVTVSWSNMGWPGKTDWIGVWAGVENQSIRDWGVPIEFRDVCAALDCSRGAPSAGEIQFTLLNRRAPYRFVYVGGKPPYFEHKAVSDALEYENFNVPMNIHIAVGPTTSEGPSMYVMWVQRTVSLPAAYYGLYANNLQWIAEAVQIRRIDPNDFCDKEHAPAKNEGFFNLSYMVTAQLSVRWGETYFYRVGEPDNGYSETFRFNAPPAPGAPVKVLAFGDMGQAQPDGSQEQSWDNKYHGEIGSLDTASAMSGLVGAFDVLLHFGDISYATGYLSEWDNFMHIIEPVASTTPYMTGIGNHEFGYSGSMNKAADSGGECGIPYNFYFPFASQNFNASLADKKPYYSFNYGNVHVAQMSTEHDFEPGSEQYSWLESDLESVNRSATPWVVLTAHRPLYVDSSWSGDQNFSNWMVDTIEPLMVEHKVNLGLYGHYHAYQRSCPMVKGECTPAGPTNFVLGMAGYELTHNSPDDPATWAEYRDSNNYGFSILDFSSAEKATLQFINASDSREVLDEVTIENYALR